MIWLDRKSFEMKASGIEAKFKKTENFSKTAFLALTLTLCQSLKYMYRGGE
jgi:hypothetical protein